MNQIGPPAVYPGGRNDHVPGVRTRSPRLPRLCLLLGARAGRDHHRVDLGDERRAGRPARTPQRVPPVRPIDAPAPGVTLMPHERSARGHHHARRSAPRRTGVTPRPPRDAEADFAALRARLERARTAVCRAVRGCPLPCRWRRCSWRAPRSPCSPSPPSPIHRSARRFGPQRQPRRDLRGRQHHRRHPECAVPLDRSGDAAGSGPFSRPHRRAGDQPARLPTP
jgi:hypothetical protein